MYSPFQLAVKYLRYYVTASSGKGHGVHSPFVFSFIEKVLNDKLSHPAFEKIEEVRRRLLNNNSVIEVEDFGAGSGHIKTRQRQVGKMAASSLKPKKYAQLIYRIAAYFAPQAIIELGTSFGVTTSYLASAQPRSAVYTFEGSGAIADIAAANFKELGLKNIELIRGNFENTLHQSMNNIHSVGLVFIDGNHRKEPTLKYFDEILQKSSRDTVFIFDDIHWSKEMEDAWATIQQHPQVTLTIDLFFVGLVFLRSEFHEKHHTSIRY